MNGRFLLGSVLGCVALIPAGCIIVADNESYPSSTSRLSASELSSVPEIPAGGAVPTLREKYAAEFARVEPGMSVGAFRDVFKDAIFTEQRRDENGVTEAYSLVFKQRYRYRNSDRAFIERDEAWFYFRDGKLIRWGRPSEWP